MREGVAVGVFVATALGSNDTLQDGLEVLGETLCWAYGISLGALLRKQLETKVGITVGFGEGSTGGNVGLKIYGVVNAIVGNSDGNIEVDNKVDKDEGVQLGIIAGKSVG